MTYAERVRRAVDNEEWQTFRLSMKGESTSEKITMLEEYYDGHVDGDEDVKIRIDNYIKALCRGGQLEAGMDFDHFNDGSIRNHIIR